MINDHRPTSIINFRASTIFQRPLALQLTDLRYDDESTIEAETGRAEGAGHTMAHR